MEREEVSVLRNRASFDSTNGSFLSDLSHKNFESNKDLLVKSLSNSFLNESFKIDENKEQSSLVLTKNDCELQKVILVFSFFLNLLNSYFIL